MEGAPSRPSVAASAATATASFASYRGAVGPLTTSLVSATSVAMGSFEDARTPTETTLDRQRRPSIKEDTCVRPQPDVQ